MAKAKKVEKQEDEAPVKKVSPKTAKKTETATPTPAAKKTKSPEPTGGENMIHLKDLCEKYGVNPRDARIKLRKALERGEGSRWSWDEEDDEVDQVKEILKGMADRKTKGDEDGEDEAPVKAKGKKVAKDEAPAPKKAAKKVRAKAKDEDEDEDED